MVLPEFVDQALGRLEGTPVDVAVFAGEGARGSILNGASGVVFFLLEVARLRPDAAVLPLARRWCDAAKAWAARAAPSEWNDTPFGFIVGQGGLAYVDALLCAREGNREGVLAAVEWIERASARFGEASSPTLRPTEFLGGAAGVVCLARDLDARLPSGSDHAAARTLLAQARERALDVVLARYRSPLAPSPRDQLGFAHGIAGELWALTVTMGADHPIVRARLEELAALQETDEEGLVYWLPWLSSDATFLLGTWCNGMAGHTLLRCEVARQTRSREAMELARRCAESVVVLEGGGASICCGHAGQALALRRYAELSGDAQAKQHADERLLSAVEMAPTESPSCAYLWQGTLGVALVAMQSMCGEREIPLQEPAPGRLTDARWAELAGSR